MLATLMEKVIANNAFETIMAHVNFHVNYINVVVNVERKGAPALVVKVNTTNAPKLVIGHVKSHVNLVNVNSNVDEENKSQR